MNMRFFYSLSFWFFCLSACWGQFVSASETWNFTENDKHKQLSLSEGTMPILTYQYDVIEHEHVPASNPRRTAGCYVHPLYGINGEILTDNAPADHYHQHGVFWKWSHVGIHEPDGEITEHSLWENNTGLKQYFVTWLDKSTSDEWATFKVENGWFIGLPQDGKKIMKEQVKITVHRVKEVDRIKSRAVDFDFEWEPTDKPITLRGVEGKSYGGFSMRFRPFVEEGQKEAQRSEINKITTPAGIAEADLPETPLPWADYTSIFAWELGGLEFNVSINAQPKEGTPSTATTKEGMYTITLNGQPIQGILTQDGKPAEGATVTFTPRNQPSGAAIFIPKTHPDFPPTWLTRYYGPLCVGWPGVKGQTFQPGEKINLCYRIWIHEGAVTVPQIQKAYEEFRR